MQNEFTLLAGLVDRAEAEVEGRTLPEPPAPVKLKLQHFACGTLPPAEQAGLVGLLNQNRHWIGLLAQEVKARRLQNPAGDGNSTR